MTITTNVPTVGDDHARSPLPYTRTATRSGTHPRTLPVRVAPVDGESLTSWLAAIAARAQTPWYVLLNTIVPRTPDRRGAKQFLHLDEFADPEQVAAIAMASSIAKRRVSEMTLAGSFLPVVRVDLPAARVSTPWGRPVEFRRYCPACLNDNGGRWLLQWRLPWVTTCIEHGCLLHDRCPTCGRQQTGPTGCSSDRLPPNPHQCCCTADLSRVPLLDLPSTDIIRAQKTLNTEVAHPRTTRGIYANTPTSSTQLLVDIRRLARRVLNAATPKIVTTLFDAGDREQAHQWLERVWRNEPDNDQTGVRFATNASTAVVAIGALAALHVIGQRTLDESAATLSSLMQGRGRGRQIYPTDLHRGYRPSAELCAIEVIAQSTQWDSLEKLRFRIHSPLPRRLDSPSLSTRMALSVPTLMWTPWAVALSILDHDLAWTTYRRVLAWLMLEIGARPTERLIRDSLHTTAERKRVSHFADAMSRDPRWRHVGEALTALHTHLADHPAPIDYQRRRRLDYSNLLSTDEWMDLWPHAEALHPRPAPVRVARIWLFERLSGIPAGTQTTIASDRSALDRFLLRLTPALKAALDAHANRFLVLHGITDEPITWSPPLYLVGDHLSPTPLDQTGVAKLHTLLLNSTRCTVADVAQQLAAPVPVIRHLLEEYPLPPRRAKRRTWQQQLADTVNDGELRRLYCEDGLTFKEIGQRYGIPKDHVAKRARECGIPRHRPPRAAIPAAWIQEHHIERGQTVAEMAAELGVECHRVRYWAEKHQIPMRRYYRRTEDSEIRRYAIQFGVQDLLDRLLLDKSGWNRLQRFRIAAAHRNLAEAAEDIGCRSDTLCHQIAALETTLGVRLIERTTSAYTPMTITPEGDRLAVAVFRIEHHKLNSKNLQQPNRPVRPR
jgi:hypothetical protein